jgi:hypothetical protein
MKTGFMIAVGALLALLGCGSSGGGGGGSNDQACADLAKARCSRIAACSSTVFAIRYPDDPTCQAREKASCLAALAAPSTGNSAQASESCATALQGNVDCTGFLDGSPPAACQAKFGTLPMSAPCAFHGQCQSAYCTIGPGAVCGTCGMAPGMGASCATEFCGTGLECTFETKMCAAPVGMGSGCDAAPCQAGYVCRGAMGARTCQPVMGTAMANGACGAMANGWVSCAAEGFCKIPMGMATGTCLAVAADGGSCDDDKGPLCAIPARCVSGTCQLPNASICH